MSSDPLERSRRKARARRPVVGWTGILGLGLLLFPVGAAFEGLSVAAKGTVLGATVDPSPLVGWVLAECAVLALGALFMACQTAVKLLRPGHYRSSEEPDPHSLILRAIADHRESHVSACVLGAQTMRAWSILLCVFPAEAIVTALTANNPGQSNPDPFTILVLSMALLAIPVVGLSVILSDLIAQNYAAVHPRRVALRYAGFVRAFTYVFAAPSWIAMKLAGLVTSRFGASATFDAADRAEDEIKGLVESFQEAGEIEREEQVMINSVFEFGDTVAREIMTPRIDVESVPLDIALVDLAALVHRTGHSRFPVYEHSDDEIVGVLHAKDVLAAIVGGQQGLTARDIPIRPAYFVPENKPLHDLLTEMRARKAQLVVIQDEYGGTAGIVTVEDIVEEVVGEIVDEYDAEETPVRDEDGGHVVDGKLHLDDLNEAIGADFESEEFDTVGGYVFGLFGKQPNAGESVEDGRYKFEIQQTDGRRIQAIKVSRLEESPAEPSDRELNEEKA